MAERYTPYFVVCWRPYVPLRQRRLYLQYADLDSRRWKEHSCVRNPSSTWLIWGFRSFVIDYLKTTLPNKYGLGYIYFNYKEQQLLPDILGSLLQQLLRQQKCMSNKVRGLYEQCGNGKRRPTCTELSALLQWESQFFSKLFVIVDALDEYSYIDDATPKLLFELQKLQPNLRLLITSRPHVSNVIQQHLPDAVLLPIRAYDEDIKKYLDKRIMMEKFLGLLIKKSPEIEEIIKQKITEKARGMSVLLYLLS